MRKTTLIAIGILLAAAVGLTLMLDYAVQHVRPELENRRVLEEAFRGELLPPGEVRLRYVEGGEGYPVEDPAQHGLIVEVSPSPERWTKDRSAVGLARELAERAFPLYGADRPITWVLLRMKRSDEGVVLHAFRRGDGDRLEALPPVVPKGR